MAAEIPDDHREAPAIPHPDGLEAEQHVQAAPAAGMQPGFHGFGRRGTFRHLLHETLDGAGAGHIEQLVDVHERQLALGVAGEREKRLVGAGAAPVQDEHRALLGALHQGAVTFVGIVQRFLRPGALPLQAKTLQGDEEQQQGDDQGDDQGDADDSIRVIPNLGVDVLDVQTRPDDPAPRLEMPHVRLLGRHPPHVVLPLPHVLQVAFPPLPRQPHHFDEDPVAGGVAVLRQVLSVEIGAVGMHHHSGVVVGDPEVILALFAVAEVLDAHDGGRLGIRPGEATVHFFPVVFLQNAGRGSGQFPDHLPLAGQQGLFEGGDQVEKERAHQQADGQQRGQQDTQQEVLPVQFLGLVPPRRRRNHLGPGWGGFHDQLPERPPGVQGEFDHRIRQSRHVRAVVIAARTDGQFQPAGHFRERTNLLRRIGRVDGLDAVQAVSPVPDQPGLQSGQVIVEHQGVCQEGPPAGLVDPGNGVRDGQAAAFGGLPGEGHGLDQRR